MKQPYEPAETNKPFEPPTVEIIRFQAQDVIAASGPIGRPGDFPGFAL